jgi:hypothetical protein
VSSRASSSRCEVIRNRWRRTMNQPTRDNQSAKTRSSDHAAGGSARTFLLAIAGESGGALRN